MRALADMYCVESFRGHSYRYKRTYAQTHADIVSNKHIGKQAKVLFPSPNCIQHPAPAHGTNLLSPACVCVYACACVEHVSEFDCVCYVLLCESVRVHDVPIPCVWMSHKLNLCPFRNTRFLCLHFSSCFFCRFGVNETQGMIS